MTITEILEYVGLTGGGGVLGWLASRRKNKAEGVEATIKVFERTIDHLSEQVELLRKENKELRDRVRHLEERLEK